METKEIIENNKLIAEFMMFEKTFIQNCDGVPYDYHLPDIFELIKEVEISIEGENGWGLVEQNMCQIIDLKFHSSWDWLMPVVEKIESLGFWTKIGAHTSFDNNYKSFDIKKINSKSDGEYIYNYEGDWNESKIDAVYHGVVEFIKWINNH